MPQEHMRKAFPHFLTLFISNSISGLLVIPPQEGINDLSTGYEAQLQLWLFMSISVLLLIGISLIFRNKYKADIAKRIELETLIKEQKETIEDQKERLASKNRSLSVNSLEQSMSSVKPRLLIVESNIDLRCFIADTLKEVYQLQEVVDGQAAWNLLIRAKKKPFDLVLSSQTLPIMDGQALLKNIKANSKLSTLPIVLLMTRTEAKTRISDLKTGIDDFLIKPFSKDELMLTIQYLLDNQKARESHRFNQKNSNGNVHQTNFNKEDYKFLEGLEQFALANIAKSTLTVSNLANECAMSESTLLRNLKRLTGLSPQKFLIEIRLKEAMRLMNEKEFDSISEIASTIGYHDIRSFNRNFKLRFGKSPSQYLSDLPPSGS